jgi:hypothetical protein
MMIPKMLGIIWRMLHSVCMVLHIFMILHALGHLPIPIGPLRVQEAPHARQSTPGHIRV